MKSQATWGILGGIGLGLAAATLVNNEKTPRDFTPEGQKISDGVALKKPARINSSDQVPPNPIMETIESAFDYSKDTPLPTSEEPKFYSEIHEVFGSLLPQLVDKSKANKKLMDLNERHSAGVRSITNKLVKPAKDDDEVILRLNLISYLSYRLRFDPSIKDRLVEIIQTEIPATAETRYKAALMGDKVEIMAILAQADYQTAQYVLQGIGKGDFQMLLATEVYLARTKMKQSAEDVIQDIQTIIPNFMKKSV